MAKAQDGINTAIPACTGGHWRKQVCCIADQRVVDKGVVLLNARRKQLPRVRPNVAVARWVRHLLQSRLHPVLGPQNEVEKVVRRHWVARPLRALSRSVNGRLRALQASGCACVAFAALILIVFVPAGSLFVGNRVTATADGSRQHCKVVIVHSCCGVVETPQNNLWEHPLAFLGQWLMGIAVNRDELKVGPVKDGRLCSPDGRPRRFPKVQILPLGPLGTHRGIKPRVEAEDLTGVVCVARRSRTNFGWRQQAWATIVGTPCLVGIILQAVLHVLGIRTQVLLVRCRIVARSYEYRPWGAIHDRAFGGSIEVPRSTTASGKCAS